MEPTSKARRFFVRIEAPDAKALSQLRGQDLDLFRGSAVRAAAAQRLARAAGAATAPLAVEGLLTLEEVERLVIDGYRVTLEAEASQRARGRAKVVEFDEWLEGMER
jgi:hypothetical protein